MKCPDVYVILSGMAGEQPSGCTSIQQSGVAQLPNLDKDIEEADERIIPHILQASMSGIS